MGASGVDASLRGRRLHPGLPDGLPHPGVAAAAPRNGPRPVLGSLRHEALQTPLSRKNLFNRKPKYPNL